ncbi:MAG: low-specificity L-threonine aldolase [Jannaschia sp.]
MSYPARAGRSAANEMVDLRSDTVTRPSLAMRAAMAAAEVGDDVYGDDPTVARLEAVCAERFGKAAGAFFPSGTQSNLAALLSHCGRGDEVLVGRGYHVECAEARGSSVLGGLALEPLELREDQGIDVSAVTAAVKPDDSHYPVTRLLSLENTVGGRVVPLAVQDAAVAAARDANLSVHLDGARAFNAAVALGVEADRLARGFDTVSVCLSKGLGAPAGSVLVGDADRVGKARRWRKMLGGGMRQSGMLAAAGLHALTHNVAALAEDHRRAMDLRAGLADLPGLQVDPVETNMVWIRWRDIDAEAMRRALADAGVTISPGANILRMVTHRDVDDSGVARVLDGFRAYAEGHGVAA